MKTIVTFLAFILTIVVKSQIVSDYKYILIPTEFNDFKDNKSYGLASVIQSSLAGKKYAILSETKSSWPSDARTNPCKVLTADVLNDKNMFRNKLILQFKDCNNKLVAAEKGTSMIKEFEPGFRDAVKQALAKIPVSTPSADIGNMQEIPRQETMATGEESKTKAAAANSKAAKTFRNGIGTFQKIQIDDKQFILVDGVSSVPFATFKMTTKPDVFRVKLSSEEWTIGYFEDENIVIETPKSDGEYSKEIFVSN
ncbi:MAG: hypothetical protein L6262_02540 [Weeksellaceae bacterium]|nr:hypothetical protein [Weeksellaceae bacterium]